ncbi:conserved domain protein [Parvimonas sp. oral taxon 393 str. F0440]|nr:conserved domain protein [Parvimonas sp. oral taxon 393 str. F0440]
MKNLGNWAKRIFVFSLVLLGLIVIPFNDSFADTFYKNAINVRINKDGSADIESIMDFQPTKGTEYYIPLNNLGKSDIVNFKVSEFVDGQEVLYESVESWDTKLSREEKAKKSGIVKTEKGYELCFGFGEYQRKTFILRYRVTDFIKLLKDSDMIYWQFVNKGLSAAPGEVKLTIFKEDGKFDDTNSKIWAFGNKGKIEFLDGKIVFESLTGLTSSNYVTVLVKLNKGDFTAGETIDKDFSYYQDLAFKGSDYKKKSENSNEKSSNKFFYIIIGIVVALIVLFKVFGKKKNRGYGMGDLKGEYYRDIPEKEWWKLSYLLDNAGFDGQDSIIRAFFLKWIQEKILIPVTEEKGLIFKKDVLALKINRGFANNFESKVERKLFAMFEEAAGVDGILQQNEFSKYLEDTDHQEEYESLEDDLEELSFEYARQNDLFEKSDKGKYSQSYNEKGTEFSGKLVKYYNYLNDFSLLSEREISEIKVWKYLLIYATLYDVADVVEKQLKQLSPELLRNAGVDLDTLHAAVIYSDVFSTDFADAYDSSVEKASDGGGGFTSTGGGDDSFGGGDGGGTR